MSMTACARCHQQPVLRKVSGTTDWPATQDYSYAYVIPESYLRCTQYRDRQPHPETWGTWTDGACTSGACATEDAAVAKWEEMQS
jgi:hypothetical protein